MKPAGGRYEELDAVRGVAALAVGLSHHLVVIEGIPPESGHATASHAAKILRYAPTYGLMAGYESVILFFVLSGFVLTLPWLRGRQDAYPLFMLRRVARLWLPYMASVAVALGACASLRAYPPPRLGAWLTDHWVQPITPRVVLAYIPLVEYFDSNQFNPVLWSLVVEMRVAIVFPLVAWVAVRLSTRWGLTVAAVTGLAPILLMRVVASPQTLDYLTSLHFVGVFIFGGVLAKQFPRLLTRFDRLRPPGRTALFLGACAVYDYGRVASHVLPYSSDYLIAPASAVFFVFAVGSASGRRLLGLSISKFLGRISFSYYLVHAVVLFATFRLLFGRFGLVATSVVSLLGGLGGATLFYLAVERPALALSRRLGSRLGSDRRRLPVDASAQ